MLPSTLTVRRTSPVATSTKLAVIRTIAADALVAADHHPGGAEPSADVDRKRILEVRVGAQVPQRVVDPGAADDRQAVDVLQVRADGLGDAGADPVVRWLTRDVRERHHRDRVLDRTRRRPRR